MTCRHALLSDAPAVAELHADSWRRNYRGAYLDSYLDGDVETDRLEVWIDRLSLIDTGRFTLVAEEDGVVVGFVHTILDEDPVWGAYLENLHVAHHLKARGIGRRLVAAAARELVERRPASGLYLWVLEQNTAAQAFYEALGGERRGRELRGPFPGGGQAFGLRYAWPDPSEICAIGGDRLRRGHPD